MWFGGFSKEGWTVCISFWFTLRWSYPCPLTLGHKALTCGTLRSIDTCHLAGQLLLLTNDMLKSPFWAHLLPKDPKNLGFLPKHVIFGPLTVQDQFITDYGVWLGLQNRTCLFLLSSLHSASITPPGNALYPPHFKINNEKGQLSIYIYLH